MIIEMTGMTTDSSIKRIIDMACDKAIANDGIECRCAFTCMGIEDALSYADQRFEFQSEWNSNHVSCFNATKNTAIVKLKNGSVIKIESITSLTYNVNSDMDKTYAYIYFMSLKMGYDYGSNLIPRYFADIRMSVNIARNELKKPIVFKCDYAKFQRRFNSLKIIDILRFMDETLSFFYNDDGIRKDSLIVHPTEETHRICRECESNGKDIIGNYDSVIKYRCNKFFQQIATNGGCPYYIELQMNEIMRD